MSIHQRDEGSDKLWDLGIADLASNWGKKLIKLRLWLRIHTDDDHHWNETIVRDDLGFLQSPVAPILQALGCGMTLRAIL